MKTFKVIIMSICLFSLTSLSAKTYNPGTQDEKVVPNVFDVCILLDSIDTVNYSYEETQLKQTIADPQDQKLHLPGITCELRNIILEEEAAIVSIPIMRNIFRAAQAWPKYKMLTTLILNAQKWDIYFTRNREFVVILPRSKYADLIITLPAPQEQKISLERLGLDHGKLMQFKPVIDPHATKTPKQQRFEAFWSDIFYKSNRTPHEINVDTLTNIFYTEEGRYNVNKRVFLVGHGSDAKDNERTADLKIPAFRTLRDKLCDALCSLLYIQTCCGGSTVFQAQTAMHQELQTEQQQLPEEQQPLSSKKFIEIAEGIPGAIVYGSKMGFGKFFSRVNNFFSEQTEKFKDLLHESGLNVDAFINLKEQFIIRNLIERSPKIHNNENFRNIFAKGFVGRRLENIPRCRFPGSPVFKPIEQVIPNINDQHILHSEIQDPSFEVITIKPDTTDVIIETTIVNKPIYIDTTLRDPAKRMPKIHPSMLGQSHHYIKEIIINYTGTRPRLTEITLKNLLPKQPRHDKAIFVSNLTFRDQNAPQNPKRSFSAENVFVFKPAASKMTLGKENYLCSYNPRAIGSTGKCEPAYTSTSFSQTEVYDTIRKKYKPETDIHKTELRIFEMMGLAKPRRYREESEEESERTIFDGIKTKRRFTAVDSFNITREDKFTRKYLQYLIKTGKIQSQP